MKRYPKQVRNRSMIWYLEKERKKPIKRYPKQARSRSMTWYLKQERNRSITVSEASEKQVFDMVPEEREKQVYVMSGI